MFNKRDTVTLTKHPRELGVICDRADFEGYVFYEVRLFSDGRTEWMHEDELRLYRRAEGGGVNVRRLFAWLRARPKA